MTSACWPAWSEEERCTSIDSLACGCACRGYARKQVRLYFQERQENLNPAGDIGLSLTVSCVQSLTKKVGRREVSCILGQPFEQGAKNIKITDPHPQGQPRLPACPCKAPLSNAANTHRYLPRYLVGRYGCMALCSTTLLFPCDAGVTWIGVSPLYGETPLQRSKYLLL